MCWFKKMGKTLQYIISWPFYDIVLDFEHSQNSISQEVLDGSNDSANVLWLNLEEITTENASPLVLKVKSELSGFPELDMTSYRNWKVK